MIPSTRAIGASIAVVLGLSVLGAHGLLADEPAPRPAPPSVAEPEQWRLVADVVDSARLRDGRLLSARTRRVLDPHAFPAQLEVAGRVVEPSDLVPADATVTVVPGHDRVEPLARRRMPLRPLLSVVHGKRVVRPRVVEVTVGAVSGEEVRRRVLLVTPAVKPRWHGQVLLTFDDGPDPTWTPRVLALLKAHHVHAVFCLVGREARKHPDLVQRILREGHSLCDHTENHDEHLPAEPADVARLEILRGADAVRRATGIRPVWFRAPGGHWSPEVEAMVRANGMVPLKWTIDPRDWERPPARLIVGRVLATARPGGILLLHDGGGDRRETLAALRSLLVALPRIGLTFAEPHPPAPPRPPAPSPSPQPTAAPTPSATPSP